MARILTKTSQKLWVFVFFCIAVILLLCDGIFGIDAVVFPHSKTVYVPIICVHTHTSINQFSLTLQVCPSPTIHWAWKVDARNALGHMRTFHNVLFSEGNQSHYLQTVSRIIANDRRIQMRNHLSTWSLIVIGSQNQYWFHSSRNICTNE